MSSPGRPAKRTCAGNILTLRRPVSRSSCPSVPGRAVEAEAFIQGHCPRRRSRERRWSEAHRLHAHRLTAFLYRRLTGESPESRDSQIHLFIYTILMPILLSILHSAAGAKFPHSRTVRAATMPTLISFDSAAERSLQSGQDQRLAGAP